MSPCGSNACCLRANCTLYIDRLGQFPRLIDFEFHNIQVGAINCLASFLHEKFPLQKPAFTYFSYKSYLAGNIQSLWKMANPYNTFNDGPVSFCWILSWFHMEKNIFLWLRSLQIAASSLWCGLIICVTRSLHYGWLGRGFEVDFQVLTCQKPL